MIQEKNDRPTRTYRYLDYLPLKTDERMRVMTAEQVKTQDCSLRVDCKTTILKYISIKRKQMNRFSFNNQDIYNNTKHMRTLIL
mgnify:CR=1 FL=1